MKQFPVVESVMTQVKFSEARLEKYFNKTPFVEKGLADKFSRDLENIACRSIHTIAKGFIKVVFANGKGNSVMSVDIPVSAHFLVTGVRTYRQRSRMTFAASLS